MPTVRGGSQVTRGGGRSRADIEKTERDAVPRDDLKGAYAGDENAEKWNGNNDQPSHSTNVKGRKTEASKERTPER